MSLLLSLLDQLPENLVSATVARNLTRGETLYRQGDPVEAVFAVEFGRLQMCTSTSEGKQVSIYVVRSGEWVAEGALFAENYCSDVVAEIKSRVRAFPKKQLQLALQAYPSLAAEFMSLQAKRCNTLRITLELRSLRLASERILQYFRHAMPGNSDSFELDRPLKTVASDLGLTHESFYRTFTRLIEEKVITRAGNVITLNRDAQALDPHWTDSNKRVSFSARESSIFTAGRGRRNGR